MQPRQDGQRPAIPLRSRAAICCRLLVGLTLGLAACGCAGFWDEVTSREFKFKDVFKPAPEPMWVIRNSTDGDKKSKALRKLKEPLQNGGTQQQQDEVVAALVAGATEDPQPLCRMAAISTLQHFKDPRAAKALVDAYDRASYFQRERPEAMATIRCQALAALGVNGNPIGTPLLVEVVGAPQTVGVEKEKQQSMDERIAAARALARFPQYQAAEALVRVLRTDQDVALRNRAGESLREMTGQDLPTDAEAWAGFLHKSGNDALAKKPSLTDKFLKLVSFPGKKPTTDNPPAGGNDPSSTPADR